MGERIENAKIGVNAKGVPFEITVPVTVVVDEGELSAILMKFPDVPYEVPSLLEGDFRDDWDGPAVTVAGYDWVNDTGDPSGYGALFRCGYDEGRATAALRHTVPQMGHWPETPHTAVDASLRWDDLYEGVVQLSGWRNLDAYEFFTGNLELVQQQLLNVIQGILR